MEIDPRRQQASVTQQVATRQSQQATLAYDKVSTGALTQAFRGRYQSAARNTNTAVSAYDASKANVEATDATSVSRVCSFTTLQFAHPLPVSSETFPSGSAIA